MSRFQHCSVVAARCSAAVAPPPGVLGGEGANDNPLGVVIKQAGPEGGAKLANGDFAPRIAGKCAINPVWLPPMLWGG
jgi:hypothetical protein